MERDMVYTIERQTEMSDELSAFFYPEMVKLNELFNGDYKVGKSDLKSMVEKGVFLVCRRDGQITGFHLSWLFRSPLDVSRRVLQQQLFYVGDNAGRSAYLLFKEFIDFGKKQADYILTTIGSHTNIKPSTIKRWGFNEIETLYSMEIK